MQDIEIPGVAERSRWYRAFEILPGLLSWGVLLLPVALASTLPRLFGPIALGLLGAWIVASIGFNIAAVRGLRSMREHTTRPWAAILRELDDDHANQLIHAVIVATWNESREVLEPTIRAVLASDFDLGKVILVLAYEARGGLHVERQAHQLVADHAAPFLHAMAVRHDDQPGEVVGKGANITGAARELERYLAAHDIDPARVVVTTLDADNRPHPTYLAALTYAHCSATDPVRAAFQPVAVYTGNIWDAPAPMRVIAITSSLWNIGLSLRPRLIRNFSSHAQNMRALIDMDFWSVRTVVEDGHQFWRSYFWHDGAYTVHPVPVPVYQDAVLSETYRRTLKAQFIQLRRWAWGVSDVAYVAEHGFLRPNSLPKRDLTFKFLRLLVGHLGWATSPLLLAITPLALGISRWHEHPWEIPAVAGALRVVGLLGAGVGLACCLQLMPSRPPHRRRRRWALMILQWLLVPVTAVFYNSLAALSAQTRLMLGRHIDTFDLTEKAVVRAYSGKPSQSAIEDPSVSDHPPVTSRASDDGTPDPKLTVVPESTSTSIATVGPGPLLNR